MASRRARFAIAHHHQRQQHTDREHYEWKKRFWPIFAILTRPILEKPLLADFGRRTVWKKTILKKKKILENRFGKIIGFGKPILEKSVWEKQIGKTNGLWTMDHDPWSMGHGPWSMHGPWPWP